MRNYVQRGENLTVAAPYAVLSGAGVKLGAIFGVAAEDADQGATVDLATCGVFSLPKVAALAVAVGDLVFWDDSAKQVTKTASGNTRIGVAVTAAADPSPSVDVRLNGSF
ncbi:Hypothetical protein HVPorG_04935 [Roseomonas mucosa]|uniref:DUF2190 family protein n=1 Tax=Roseomonas mucosa TaxID=207340 RepID=UPI0021FC27F3|nr:DUF2190 family protein [Roseomonas mucosa]QDJ10790.1 Hypothetical protein HVPorG_04935 [Roseomonas mucosa]